MITFLCQFCIYLKCERNLTEELYANNFLKKKTTSVWKDQIEDLVKQHYELSK